MSQSPTRRPTGTSGVEGGGELEGHVTDRSSKKTKRATDREIKRYLRTGKHDHDFGGWPGHDYVSRVTAVKQAREVAIRFAPATPASLRSGLSLVTQTKPASDATSRQR